jgi:hypothetical protein
VRSIVVAFEVGNPAGRGATHGAGRQPALRRRGDRPISPDVTRAFRWLLVALLGWWTVRFAVHPLDAGVVNGSFLHLVNLPFHEAGHVLFAPFGALLMALGGSLLQVMVPLACALAFLQRQDAFGAWVCGWWAGQNLIDLAPYIADARALQLVLIGGMTGAEVEGHDWEFILQSLGWLHLDRRIALTAHLFGSLAMVSAVAGAAWAAAGRVAERPRR